MMLEVVKTINAELFNSSECWIVKSEILSLKIFVYLFLNKVNEILLKAY